ncbi:MAG: Eco57I restriction-modification methylase domain-containing protein, partial [Promethearchaeota archaeon]
MKRDTLDVINARWTDVRSQEELIITIREQIRKAVEILLESLNEAQRTSPDLMNYLIADPRSQQQISEQDLLESVYQATINIIMRLVFILFAESRDLLPRRQNLSEVPYSLEKIYLWLEKTHKNEVRDNLQHNRFAWSQLILLFRCIYNGNTSPNIKFPFYGGKLFRPGDKNSFDPILRALALFEDELINPSDTTVLKILRLLKSVRVTTQKKPKTWIDKPVDFSQMQTEYIGAIYEGLLDYSLQKKSDRSSLNLEKPLPMFSTRLVKRVGNRKETGTFYTKPDLVNPTLQRTLEPLVYHNTGKDKIPRKPEEILSLKIADPAMGSASFLVAALEYITNALVESLIYHGNVKSVDTTEKVVLLPLPDSKNNNIEVVIPTTGRDEQLDRVLGSKVKRYVVENCVYGVDINPLAVELAKLILWIEIGDKNLPFTFLDHNLKVGNALVGCWFDHFQDYPVMAWNRGAGDEKRVVSVNFRKNEFSQQLKRMRRVIKKQMISDIEEKEVNVKQKEVPTNSEFINLKEAFDVWCAIWFWPIDDLENAPQPNNFLKPTEQMLSKVKEIASRINFFHWELEFPDVFERENGGFDAVVGNPPWETIKPLSKEFFSEYDPLYRNYGKQEALSQQRLMFKKSKDIEKNWLLYNAEINAITNYTKRATFPLGNKKEPKREDLISKNYPFRYQGHGSPTTYKLFLELGLYILRKKGLLGFIVPSSIYTDLEAADLRRLFISKTKWEWLISFENRKGIFPGIHKSFKFCIIILKKGAKTDEIKTAFMLRDPMDLKRGAEYL